MIYMCVIAIQEQSTYIFFRMTGSPGAIARVVNLYFYHRLLMHTSKWCMMVHSFRHPAQKDFRDSIIT